MRVVVMYVLACLLATSEAVHCPPWFISYTNTTLSNTTQPYSHCVCSQYLPFRIICSQETFHSYLTLRNCAFWDNGSNSTMVGKCPYVFPPHNSMDMMLQLPQDVHALNSFLCTENLKRNVDNNSSGCGRCADGRGPSVTTVGSQCVKCSAVNILYYCLLQYLPATIVFLFILLVQIDVTSAPMAHYVLFCNGLVAYLATGFGFLTSFGVPGTNRYILKAFFMLNSIWSFDPLFFVSPPLCLSPHIQDIDRPYIEMLVTLYPFMLLVLAYIGIELHSRDVRLVVLLWRPLHKRIIRCRRSWNPNASLVHAFATVFYISYVKLIFLVFVPFSGVYFANEHGTIRNNFVTYVDPTIPFAHPKHIYLMVFSLCILTFIVMPPIVILMVYPTRLFTKLQSHLSPRLNLAIDTFVNTYQGCYKDGTNGTRDYRCWSGGLLALGVFCRIVGLCVDASVEVNNRHPVLELHLLIVAMITLCVAFAVLRPYKSNIANITGLTLFALLALATTLNISLLVIERHRVVCVAIIMAVVSLPHCVFYGYVVYRLYKKSNHFKSTLREWSCLKNVPEEEELLN